MKLIKTFATADKTMVGAQWRDGAHTARHCDLLTLVEDSQVRMEMGLEHFLARPLDAIHRLVLAATGCVAVGEKGFIQLTSVHEHG